MKTLKIIRRLLLVLIVLLLVFIGYYVYAISPNEYSINETTYQSSLINDKLSGLKIAYFSDVNLYDKDDVTRFEKIIDDLNEHPFDLVIFNGDLYENDVFSNNEVSSLLKKISCKYGKFALLGDQDLNHESEVKTILNDGGFEVLDHTIRPIYYNSTSFELVASNNDISDLTYADNTFTLCIAHKPDTFVSNKNYIDLQLSGHSLGGNVYFPYLGSLIKKEGALTYNHGTYIENDATLIVSNGIKGKTDFPYKFLARNQINIITLKG